MFDERALNAYRSVTAPPELRDKVLSQAKSKKTIPFNNKKKTTRMVRQISAAAACLVLLAGVWTMGRGNGDTAEMNVNAVVVTETADQGAIRMATEEPVTVKLEISCEAELNCEAGELLVQGKDDITPVECGQTCRAEKNAVVLWQIPDADAAEAYELTLSGENNSVSVTLLYDTARNCWTVSYAE